MTTLQAGLYYDHPGWYRLVCRYDPWLQGDLKEELGLGNYKYDPKLKMWYIREPYRKATVNLLRTHGYEVETEQEKKKREQEYKDSQKRKQEERQERRQNKQQVSGPRNQENPWSTIFAHIPDSPLRRKLYRAVSLVLHPDTGGNEEAMKELNEAWSKLQQ